MNKIAKALGYILYSFGGGALPHYGMGHRWMISQKIRAFCGKLYFDYCGKNVDIGRRAHLSSKMRLGNNSGIGDFCYIQGPVQIGENVMMAPYVALIAANHNVSRTDVPMNQQGAYEKQITIEDDVWIGYGAKILAGVTVGKGAVIGAGAVVTKNVAPYAVVGGIPAKEIKMRN